MAKITIEDLKRIRERTAKAMALRLGTARIKVTVHMGDCGVAAGARTVMNALLEELAGADRQDIRALTADCLGMCSSEPNVTVEVLDEEPIVYQKMDADRMRQVFRRHVLQGEVQTGFALGRL